MNFEGEKEKRGRRCMKNSDGKREKRSGMSDETYIEVK